MTYRAGILILALIFCISNAKAQDTVKTISIPDFSTLKRGGVESSVQKKTAEPIVFPKDNVVKDSDILVRKPKAHSPNKALLLSLIPGAGQVYNGQAWKIPIIYAGLGTLGYLVYDNYSQMKMFKDDYLYRIGNGGSALIDRYASYPKESIYNMYQSYNKNFQLMIIISVGVYALNLVDAYVFGHLYDFQINDDLSMHLAPVLQPNYTDVGRVPVMPALNLSFSF